VNKNWNRVSCGFENPTGLSNSKFATLIFLARVVSQRPNS